MKPHLHFMGIGGVSMSGLARHYLANGYRVSGCDASESDTVRLLRQEGIEVAVGHGPEHLEGVDLLVTTMAVSADEPEACEARRRGIRTLNRMGLLGELFSSYETVAVTGTHGKSTTSGMIAHTFVELGRDPSVQLGATLPLLGSNMRSGDGPELIAEVDESDPGFAQLSSTILFVCKKGNAFLKWSYHDPGFAQLSSAIAVIINLDDDHVAGDHEERRNYHASLADLEAAARSFAGRAGRVVACGDWPSLGPLLTGMDDVLTYGFSEDADYRISGLQLATLGSSFLFTPPGGPAVQVTLTVPGVHNVQNAAAALTVAHLRGLDLAESARALTGFGGVGRRWQRWGSDDEPLIIDDYAHHPTEVAATLKAARNTGRRIRAVLQPHRWIRTARLWPALADAAGLADEVIVLDVYSAGEAAIPGVSVDLIVDRLRESGKTAAHHDHDSAVDYLRGTAREGDLIITLGAGDVWKIARELASSTLVNGRGTAALNAER